MTTTRNGPEHGTRACYVRGCRRPECGDAHYRYMSRYRLDRERGQARRLPAAPIVERARQLAAAGWTSGQIAQAAGCAERTISALLAGQFATVSAGVAAKVMDACPSLSVCAPTTYVHALGTIRRGRALMAIGHTVVSIADAINMANTELSRVLNGRREHVRVGTAQAMTRVYAAWSTTPGVSRRARNHAARRDWPGPDYWDDEDFDNPDFRPALSDDLGRLQLGRHRRAEIEHLDTCGSSEQEIAERLDMDPKYVHDIVRELRKGRLAVAISYEEAA